MTDKIYREELRRRLRDKIYNKQNERKTNKHTRKQLSSYSDKLKKITNIVDKYNINSEEQIPTELVETVKNIISDEEIKDLIDYLKQYNSGQLNNSMIKFLSDITSQ